MWISNYWWHWKTMLKSGNIPLNVLSLYWPMLIITLWLVYFYYLFHSLNEWCNIDLILFFLKLTAGITLGLSISTYLKLIQPLLKKNACKYHKIEHHSVIGLDVSPLFDLFFDEAGNNFCVSKSCPSNPFLSTLKDWCIRFLSLKSLLSSVSWVVPIPIADNVGVNTILSWGGGILWGAMHSVIK